MILSILIQSVSIVLLRLIRFFLRKQFIPQGSVILLIGSDIRFCRRPILAMLEPISKQYFPIAFGKFFQIRK